MRRIIVIAGLAAFALAAKRPSTLPPLGTTFHSLPPGESKSMVEASCFPCHSADILAQQRLTEKQWSANVDKMIRWGAVVKESEKATMIAYLAKHFGPENKFTPIETLPVGK